MGKKKSRYTLLKEKYQRKADEEELPTEEGMCLVWNSIFNCLDWAYDLPSTKKSCIYSIKHFTFMLKPERAQLYYVPWYRAQLAAYQELLVDLNGGK